MIPPINVEEVSFYNPMQSKLIDIFNEFINYKHCIVCGSTNDVTTVEYNHNIRQIQCVNCHISAGVQSSKSSESHYMAIKNYLFYPFCSHFYYLILHNSKSITNISSFKIDSIHSIISIINKLETFK